MTHLGPLVVAGLSSADSAAFHLLALLTSSQILLQVLKTSASGSAAAVVAAAVAACGASLAAVGDTAFDFVA